MVDLESVIDFIVRRNNSDFDACGFLMQPGFLFMFTRNLNSKTVKFSSDIGPHLIAI
jgi:hypothetical protein